MPALAIGGIALALFAAAILAMLLIFATPALKRLLTQAFSKLPLIGGDVSRVLSAGLDALEAPILTWADETLSGINELLWSIGAGLWMHASQVVAAVEANVNGLYRVKNYAAGLYNSLLGWTVQEVNYLAQAIDNAEAYTFNYAYSLYQSAISYANSWGNDLLADLRGDFASLAAYSLALFNQAVAYVQQEVGAAESYAAQLFDQAQGYAAQLYNQAVAYTAAEVQAAENYASQLYNDAVSFTERVQTALLQDLGNVQTTLGQEIGTGIADAEGYAQALARTLGSEITQVAAGAASEASQAEQGAIAAAGAATATAVAGVEAQIGQGLQDVVLGPWDALLPDLQTVVSAIPDTVAQALGFPAALTQAVPDTVTGILGLVVPAIGALAHEVADCEVPMCENLGPLSNLFNGLTQDAFLAALLAFLAEAATNPAGALSEAEAVIVPPVQAAESAFRSLLGV